MTIQVIVVWLKLLKQLSDPYLQLFILILKHLHPTCQVFKTYKQMSSSSIVLASTGSIHGLPPPNNEFG